MKMLLHQLSVLKSTFFNNQIINLNKYITVSLCKRHSYKYECQSTVWRLGCLSGVSLFLSSLASPACPLQLVSMSAQQLTHTSMCLCVSLHACQFVWVSPVLTVWCTVSGRQERPWESTLIPSQRLIVEKQVPVRKKIYTLYSISRQKTELLSYLVIFLNFTHPPPSCTYSDIQG